MIEKKYSNCPLDCPDSCGLLVTLEKQRITNLSGDPDHPYTRGFLCNKMRRYPERIYAENRILYPQIRIGKKGEASFRQITWDQAWEILVEKLNGLIHTHGGNTILPYMFAGNMGLVSQYAGHPIFQKIGATRLEQTICSATAQAGWKHHCGKLPGADPAFAADAKLIVAWGINIKVTNSHFWQYITAARKNGAKLLVIDPYENDTARSADLHLRVKPGGDCALALGVIKVLLEKGWIEDKELIRETYDFSTFKESITLTPWPDITAQSGLDHLVITTFAKELVKQKDIFFRLGIGMTRNTVGAMSIRAITALAATLKLFNSRPGKGILLTSKAFGVDKETLTSSNPNKVPAAERSVNMNRLGHALMDDKMPIHGLVVYNANPLSVAPDSSQVRHGLAREDLFTVVHEQVMTPTARYADLLLPATTAFENKDIYIAYGHFYMGLVEPVIPARGEAISNFDLFQQLAIKMNYTDWPFTENIDQRIQRYLSAMEGLPEQYRQKPPNPGQWVQSTRHHDGHGQDRSFKYRFSSNSDLKYPALPSLPVLRKDQYPCSEKDFPFHLITPPHPKLLNSTFGDFHQDLLGEVFIHPLDAEAHRIREGQQVRLYNDRGQSYRIARINTKTEPGLLVAEGLFWESKEIPSAINDLTSQELSDMGGGSIFHESRVAMEKVGN